MLAGWLVIVALCETLGVFAVEKCGRQIYLSAII